MGQNLHPAFGMSDLLTILLRAAGAGLLLLAILHIPISRQLKWKEEGARMSPANTAIFHVHAIFICIVLLMMATPCLLEPSVFLTSTRAGLWMSWSYAVFWAIRLYFQWFVYGKELRQGKRFETILHWWFTLVWTSLSALFAACALFQQGWWR